MAEIHVDQGVAHACHHDGFQHLGMFDEAPGTLQGPGVRADAQCCKITWLEELASERFFIDISGSINSFGLDLCVVRE